MIGNGIFFFAHDGVFTCSSSVTVLLVFIMEYLHVHDWLRYFLFIFLLMMKFLHVHVRLQYWQGS